MKKLLLGLTLVTATLLAGKPKPSTATWELEIRKVAKGILNVDGTGGDVATFTFPDTPLANYLYTTKAPNVGNLTGKTVTASVNLTYIGTPEMIYWDAGGINTCAKGCCTPANVRLYFTSTSTYSGTECTTWWCTTGATMVPGGSFTLTDNFDPSHWSSGYGHLGSDPAHLACFQDAVAHVYRIGLAVGCGGCFYDIGTGAINGTVTFHLTNFVIQ